MTKEPRWPKERDLTRYSELSGFEIQEHLRSGGQWIDVGVGKGAKPMRPLIGYPGVTLKAISPHSRALPRGISLTKGRVPEDATFLSENRGRSRLVTDIFGAVSYCDDPVQALVYGALLLDVDGVFVGFTELHRIGDLETWDRTTEFIQTRLGQTITFQTVFMLGDSSGVRSTYLRVRIEGKSPARTSLPTLLKEVRRIIGVPRHGKPLWTAPDESVKIWATHYFPAE